MIEALLLAGIAWLVFGEDDDPKAPPAVDTTAKKTEDEPAKAAPAKKPAKGGKAAPA